MMRKKPIDHIYTLTRYATEINITLPTTVIDAHIIDTTEFQPLTSSLTALQNNETLNVTITQLQDTDLTCINITLNEE